MNNNDLIELIDNVIPSSSPNYWDKVKDTAIIRSEIEIKKPVNIRSIVAICSSVAACLIICAVTFIMTSSERHLVYKNDDILQNLNVNEGIDNAPLIGSDMDSVEHKYATSEHQNYVTHYANKNIVYGNMLNMSESSFYAGVCNDNSDFSNWKSTLSSWNSYILDWGVYPSNRIAVTVNSPDGVPLSGVKVSLYSISGDVLWVSVSDVEGKAYLFSFYEKISSANVKAEYDNGDVSEINNVSLNSSVSLNQPAFTQDTVDKSCPNMPCPDMHDNDTPNAPTDTPIDNIFSVIPEEPVPDNVESPSTSDLEIDSDNNYLLDLAFVIDTTKTMANELDYLKKNIASVYKQIYNMYAVNNESLVIRTAFVFYRDNGDKYVTQVYDFTSNNNDAITCLQHQSTDGGADTPDAVHRALEAALGNLSWSADTRLMFLLTDSPPHNTVAVNKSIASSLSLASSMGVRIIPVACSGTSSETEYLLRTFALITNGSYVFLSNGSDVNTDLKATIGNYQACGLDVMLVKIILSYLINAE